MTKDEALKLCDYLECNDASLEAQCKAAAFIRQALAQPDPEQTHTINSTQTAAVATDYYWIPIDENTPRGVKLQLLGKGGVAHYSTYHGASHWTHWAPLPKRRD